MVTQYFNNLAHLWQRLDMFEVHDLKYSKDTMLYHKTVEQRRTFNFLLSSTKTLSKLKGERWEPNLF